MVLEHQDICELVFQHQLLVSADCGVRAPDRTPLPDMVLKHRGICESVIQHQLLVSADSGVPAPDRTPLPDLVLAHQHTRESVFQHQLLVSADSGVPAPDRTPLPDMVLEHQGMCESVIQHQLLFSADSGGPAPDRTPLPDLVLDHQHTRKSASTSRLWYSPLYSRPTIHGYSIHNANQLPSSHVLSVFSLAISIHPPSQSGHGPSHPLELLVPHHLQVPHSIHHDITLTDSSISSFSPHMDEDSRHRDCSITLIPPSTPSDVFRGYPTSTPTSAGPAMHYAASSDFFRGYQSLGDEPIGNPQMISPKGVYHLTPTKRKQGKRAEGTGSHKHIKTKRRKRRHPSPALSPSTLYEIFPVLSQDDVPNFPIEPVEHVPNFATEPVELVPQSTPRTLGVSSTPQPHDAKYDAYVQAILAQSAGFYQLSPEVFVAQGWNARSTTVNVRESHSTACSQSDWFSDDLVPSPADQNWRCTRHYLHVSESTPRDTMCPPSIFIRAWRRKVPCRWNIRSG